MSDNHDYLGTSASSRIFADILALMMKGAGYAAIFCFVLLLVGWFLVFLAGLLPPASKEAPDPTPNSQLRLDAETAFA